MDNGSEEAKAEERLLGERPGVWGQSAGRGSAPGRQAARQRGSLPGRGNILIFIR